MKSPTLSDFDFLRTGPQSMSVIVATFKKHWLRIGIWLLIILPGINRIITSAPGGAMPADSKRDKIRSRSAA